MEYLLSYYLFGFEISILKFFFGFVFKYSKCNNFFKKYGTSAGASFLAVATLTAFQ